MATIIKVQKNLPKKQGEKIRSKKSKVQRRNVARHFGKLKWPMDGLEYQKTMRNEWA